MALAVTFAMVSAYLLSRTFVPAMCALWLKAHGPRGVSHHGKDYQHRSEHENAPPKGWLGRTFERWEGMINAAIAGYMRVLHWALRRRGLLLAGGFAALGLVVVGLGSQLRREFFPEVDAGAFEMYVRGK